MRLAATAALLAALAALGAGCGEDEDPTAGSEIVTDRFDAERAFADLEAQVAIGPRPSGSPEALETAELIASRLEEAGVEGVRIQRPLANVVGSVPGDRPGAILLGAHFDTEDVPGFVGANDGASGVAVVLEIARVLAAGAPLQGPSVHFALFDGEEARGERPFELDGARGSRQYVSLARRGAMGTPRLNAIDSMILFDLVGDCDLSIPREANSDPELYARIASASQSMDGDEDPFEGTTGPILDDHVPFREAGVRAVVDLIDFEFGPGPSPGAWWHTTEDDLDKVCPESLDEVGEPVLRVLPAPRAADE